MPIFVFPEPTVGTDLVEVVSEGNKWVNRTIQKEESCREECKNHPN